MAKDYMKEALDASIRAGQVSRINSIISQDLNITSRDDIINPELILNAERYANDALGRKYYESDLAALRNYKNQQEAAYLDWYNSPEQQAARQREAGLNPDLVGLEGESGVQTESSTSSPLDNVMSDEQIKAQEIQNSLNVLNGIGSVIGSISSVAGLVNSFAQVGLVKSQTNQTELTNANLFQQLVHKDVAGRVANAVSAATSAGKSFSIDDFFADANNFAGVFDAYAPMDTSQYRSLYDTTLKQTQSLLGSAFDVNKGTAGSQTEFSKLVANPYYSDDVVLQVAMLEPVMSAFEKQSLVQAQFRTFSDEMRIKYGEGIDVEAAIQAANAGFGSSASESSYLEEYFKNMDGEDIAKFDSLIKESQSILDNIEASVKDNLFQIWKKNPNSQRGLSASYMLLGQTPLSLKDWLRISLFAPNTKQEYKGVKSKSFWDRFRDTSDDPENAFIWE